MDATAVEGTPRPAGAPNRSAPHPGPAAVVVRGLVKTYAGTRVVDGLDLDVARGECVALLGPNGAGKTTTVEVLEGCRSRDGGDVEVLGHDPARPDRAWRARLGIVAQADLGAVDLTVLEMLGHFRHYHVDPRPTDELVAMVGLERSARVRVADLSGGQRRRLDVALGVQGRPELLFLDEPTTGFDPAARRQFWDLVQRLQREGTTILLTTHYLEEAAYLADRVAVITAGRLVEVAAPDRLGGRLGLGATVAWTGADGRRQEVVTTTPTAALRAALAAQPDGELAELTVTRPSLEDIYLRMVEPPADVR